jgi:hypothetical protein
MSCSRTHRSLSRAEIIFAAIVILLIAWVLVPALAFSSERLPVPRPEPVEIKPPSGVPLPMVQCNPSLENLEDELFKRWKEELAAEGLIGDGSAGTTHLFISPKGTYTLVVRVTGMQFCIALTGESWSSHLPLAPNRGA